VSFRRGCGVFDSRGGEQGNGGRGKEIFNTYFEAPVPDLNFTTITDFYSSSMLNNAMEELYCIDENEESQPAMAEGVELNSDELTYTFAARWYRVNRAALRDY
jgi:oligopeptide transport system substrate-binding protein